VGRWDKAARLLPSIYTELAVSRRILSSYSI
jgi:hypothetical protein